tara:strand:+ start:622 stop:1017 length:396 start_codon:yes stop_codon:yes gene_type:complete
MGNHNSNVKIGFEDMQNLLNTSLIINTLSNDHQSCLIKNTLSSSHEENKINSLIYNNNFNIKIIIYGINCCDITIYEKYEQLCKLGFKNVFIYMGGLFEWLLLQDIYGNDNFPTTSKQLDILKYKPICKNI